MVTNPQTSSGRLESLGSRGPTGSEWFFSRYCPCKGFNRRNNLLGVSLCY